MIFYLLKWVETLISYSYKIAIMNNSIGLTHLDKYSSPFIVIKSLFD